MQFYPLGMIGVAATVTTASTAITSSFLDILIVNTASVALNYPGPQGPTGSQSSPILGITGPQGPIGPSGSQGPGVYLLSSASASCTFALSLGIGSDPQTACISIPSTYYASAQTLVIGTKLSSSIYPFVLATDMTYYSDSSNYWYVNSGGTVQDNGAVCTSCLPSSSVCVDNSDCCSGNCTDIAEFPSPSDFRCGDAI